MKEIVIVTAFFDIGRGDFTEYTRSAELYVEYFRFWAGIKNRMIIFCQPDFSEAILAVRREYGLADRTEIITVENIYDIEPELFERMKKIENDRDFQTFRFYSAPENRADYSYVVMLKAWCMAKAAERLDTDCVTAWIDFGINHCGFRYQDRTEFSFLWEYEFPEKITAFCHCDPETTSIIDSLQFMVCCFDGSAVIMPRNMCGHYWEAVRGAMETLVRIGCIDDDQMLSLIVYKNEPELYNIIIEDEWYSVFQLCSGRKFSLSDNTTDEPQFIQSRREARFVQKLAGMPQHPFIKRMYEKTLRYYYS